MRLLRAELNRAAHRRLTLWLLIGLVALAALFTVTTYDATRPPTATDIARAEQAWEQAQQQWEKTGEEQIAECRASEEAARSAGAPDVDFGCDDLAPKREYYIRTIPNLGEQLGMISGGLHSQVGLVALVLGAGLVGAEFSSGAMGTWLTFEPRRSRVFASKVAAAGIGSLVLGIVGLGLTSLATAIVVAVNRAPGGLGELTVGLLAGQYARSLVIITLMGIVGAAISFVVRHTAATVGLAFAYLMILETMVPGLLPAASRWLLTNNGSALVLGRAYYATQSCAPDATGILTCATIQHTITWAQATPYLLGLTALLLAGSWYWFKRSDVN